ncbi:MAG: hypothetical protein KatS3mg110_4445 [Pirellulaceae bacterium]|nr:MAG: hypothetical protein KatS3mg110_4445 [Pirellulaceae bacterium]
MVTITTRTLIIGIAYQNRAWGVLAVIEEQRLARWGRWRRRRGLHCLFRCCGGRYAVP